MRPFSGRGVYICASTMRIRVPSTAPFFCLLSMSVAAQDGLRSGSPSERTSASSSTVSEGRDLFRVPADFFSRPPDPGPSRLFFPYFLPTPGASSRFVFSSVWTHPGSARREAEPSARGSSRGDRSSKPDCCAALAALAGKAEDLYVIPGCYAGDKPPEPE